MKMLYFFFKMFFTPQLNSVRVLLVDRIRSHRNVLFVRWRLMFLKVCRAELVQSCSRAGCDCSEQSTAHGAGSGAGMPAHCQLPTLAAAC